MRTISLSVLLLSSAISYTYAGEGYETRLMTEAGFAQSEFDRLYHVDPVGTLMALIELGAVPCGAQTLAPELEKYGRMTGLGDDLRRQRLVANAVMSLGYPTPGDHNGKCEKVRAALAIVEEAARSCRATVERSKAGGGICTCF